MSKSKSPFGGDVDWRSATEEIAAWSDGELADLFHGLTARAGVDNERLFRAFANLVTYNYLADTPQEWHPIPDHFQAWHRMLERGTMNMGLAARKHMKTTFLRLRIMYYCEFVDGHGVLYWANSQDQVVERMEEMDDMIEANSWLRHLHPDTAAKRKRYPNGSFVYTTSVNASPEGIHVQQVLGDDPLKEFADVPDSQIEEWYGKVIVPMENPEGTNAIFGTRKRPSDLYELLRTKHEDMDSAGDLPTYTLTEYPAIREVWLNAYPDRADELAPLSLYTETEAPAIANAVGLDSDTVHVLWPEGRPADWLAGRLGAQGRPYWEREFCMVFRQVEDAVVEREWIDACGVPRSPPQNLRDPWRPDDVAEAVPRSAWDEVAVGIDPAGTGRDNFAFVTVGQYAHEFDGETVDVRHILDVHFQEQLPPSGFRDKLSALTHRYRPDTIMLEANLNQTWVAEDEELDPEVRRVLDTYSTGREKHGWKDGVPGMGSDIEAGKYRFYDSAGTASLTEALASLQRHNGELVGHTPDLVMALWMADRALTDMGGAAVARGRLDGKGIDREREQEDRERKRALKDSEVGRQVLENLGEGGLGSNL